MKLPKAKLEILSRKPTERGFGLITFTDYYGEACSLQESSLALYQEPGSGAVWLGTEAGRMHLTDGQVKDLIKELKHWLKTGHLKGEENEQAVTD